VGSPYAGFGEAQGAAYVFVRSGTVWAEQQKLMASDAAAVRSFGSSVSISENTVVIGASSADTAAGAAAGAAYAFVRSGTVWTQQQKLMASDAAATAFFGSSVSISGDTVVVGAPWAHPAGGEDYQGAVYLFV